MVYENQCVVLARPPQGFPESGNFKYQRQEFVPDPGSDSKVLLKNLIVALTPGDRLFLNRKIQPGEVLRGHTVSQVINAPDGSEFKTGDLVQAKGGWQRYCYAKPCELKPVPPNVPPSLSLGLLGAPGMTAYFGIHQVAGISTEPGSTQETVLISGASGMIGGIAGQLARRSGCRVLGIGTQQHRSWILNDLQLDDFVEEGAIQESLSEICPDGIDVFFDNVGGATLDKVLAFMGRYGKSHARIACCGMVSDYNRAPGKPRYGTTELHHAINRSLTLRGFLTRDFRNQFNIAEEVLKDLYKSKELKTRESVTVGLANGPQTFVDYMRRRTTGKQLIQVEGPFDPSLFAQRKT